MLKTILKFNITAVSFFLIYLLYFLSDFFSLSREKKLELKNNKMKNMMKNIPKFFIIKNGERKLELNDQFISSTSVQNVHI